MKMQSITGDPIHVFEVEVYSSGKNVAKNKSATQSSTLKTFSAALAVDGNPRTFSHTNDTMCSWWEVDLGGLVPIESVKIMNRWCENPSDTKGCLCRLSHVTVSLFDNKKWISGAWIGDTCGNLGVEYEFAKSAEYCTVV